MRRTGIAILSAMLAVPAVVVSAPQAEPGSILLQPHGNTAAVDVKLPGIEGVVSLTLPELVNDDGRRLIYTDTNLKRVQWQTSASGAIRSHWSQAGLGGYELEATPEAAGVAIHWRVINLSSELWHEASGNICMRSKMLPQFFDPTGERIFLRSKGRWVSIHETGQLGSNWYLPPGKSPLAIMKPHLQDRSYRIADLHPDEAIIAVRSRDGRFVLAQAWQKSRYLLGNVHPQYVCTEAPPAFGDLRPGETVDATGMLYFLKVDLSHLADKYHQDLQSGKIAIRSHPTAANGRFSAKP